MKAAGVKVDTIKQHLFTFFHSLKRHPDRYQPEMFMDPQIIPEHLAYLCPLCLKNGFVLTKEAGLQWNANFSIEHFPPKSVGGANELITCKHCNNETGRLVDFSLNEFVQRLSFDRNKPNSSIPIVSDIKGVKGRYRASFMVNEAGVKEIELKPNPKYHSPHLDEWIERKDKDFEIKIHLKTPKEDLVSRSILKTAYLFCFGAWGYDFAYSDTGTSMREIIWGRQPVPRERLFFRLDESIGIDKLSAFPFGFGYIQKPKEMKSVCVSMLLLDAKAKHYDIIICLIPGPLPFTWEKVCDIYQRLEDGMSSGLQISIAPGEDYLELAKGTFDYEASWRKLNNI